MENELKKLAATMRDMSDMVGDHHWQAAKAIEELNALKSNKFEHERLDPHIVAQPQAIAAQSAPDEWDASKMVGAVQSATADEREAFEARFGGCLSMRKDKCGQYTNNLTMAFASGWWGRAAWQRAQSAPVVPELTEKEREDLLEFHEAVCCDAGYRVEKEGMRRLAEIGAVESVGFGRYRMTEFGVYLLGLAQPAARQEQGDVVVTRNAAGQIVAVTRQDEEGRILSVIAEADPAGKGDEVRRLREALEEIRRADMNAPVSESNAGCIKRIKQIAERALAESKEGAA